MNRLLLILGLAFSHFACLSIGLQVGNKAGFDGHQFERKTTGKFSDFDENLLRVLVERLERTKDYDRIHLILDKKGPTEAWGELHGANQAWIKEKVKFVHGHVESEDNP